MMRKFDLKQYSINVSDVRRNLAPARLEEETWVVEVGSTYFYGRFLSPISNNVSGCPMIERSPRALPLDRPLPISLVKVIEGVKKNGSLGVLKKAKITRQLEPAKIFSFLGFLYDYFFDFFNNHF